MSFVNIRRVILKHKRGAKCPLLQKFVKFCVEQEEGNLLTTEELFAAYENAVSLWNDGDSLNGQTKFLIKKSGFHRVHTLKNMKSSTLALVNVQ